MIKHILTLFSVPLLALVSFSSHALENDIHAVNQAHSEIYNLVTEHVKQKIDQKIFEPEIKLRNLSHTLKLAKCQQALIIKDRNPNKIVGRMTFGVSCLQPKWQLYLPVAVTGKRPAVINTKGILKLAVIKSEDVESVLLPYKKVPKGSIINTETAIGMRAKKGIPPNSILKIRDFQAPYWVFKNREVTVVTRIGSIQVKTKGVALEDGVEQAQVAIKNISSNKVIKGIVIAPNTVEVP
ncbi:MAG: flagellar basal body P-ring formation protein FlgA [Thiomicrorhabdus sp.]|nr:MAG: flagellar basal body P-ring formation protein FlgA [Thiomicrorhabdus sp.]